MDYVMKAYDQALQDILENGVWRTNKRTGIRTKAVFGMLNRYRIDDRFPVMTRRKYWPQSIFKELLWVISGSTNNNDLKAMGCNIWSPWEDRDFEKKHGYVEGALGPIYGFQLRHFGGQYGNGDPNWSYHHQEPEHEETFRYGDGGFDQLAYMMQRIKDDPSCRRILFSLWNPQQMEQMKLPPCHYSFQLFIDDEGRMSGLLTQRSCDFPIGVPANIQFYSALIYMIAQQTGFEPFEFIHSTVDSHIYEDQIAAVEKYLDTPIIPSPRLKLRKAKDIYSYTPEDFELTEFWSGPRIEIPVAV